MLMKLLVFGSSFAVKIQPFAKRVCLVDTTLGVFQAFCACVVSVQKIAPAGFKKYTNVCKNLTERVSCKRFSSKSTVSFGNVDGNE